MSIPSMQPVLRRGRSVLDRQLLPSDEFEGRLERLLDSATAAGLDGVVIFGNAHMPENLVYFANYMPTTFIGTIVARRGHPATLIAGKGGARDHPYIKTISSISDVRFYPDLGQGIAAVIDEWGQPDPPRLGIVGLDDALPHEVHDSVVAAIPESRRVPFDEQVTAMRRPKSARELLVMRNATDVAEQAAAAAIAAYEGGASRRAALAAADYSARSHNAEDCRVVAGSPDGIVALSEAEDDPSTSFSLMVAVEMLGYWGVATATSGAQPDDDAALSQVAARLRPGVRASEALGSASGATEGFLVSAIGCGLSEYPDWASAPEAELAAGDVISVVHWRAGGSTVLSSRTLVLDQAGARNL
jgi:Creatinase/Prolidase N-terminal domain